MIFKNIFCLSLFCLTICSSAYLQAEKPDQTNPSMPAKQLILIGVDGFLNSEYKNLLTAGKLPNFSRLIEHGWGGAATITGHHITTTAPGNAELHSGLGESINGISDNTCGVSLKAGTSTFERLNSFSPAVRLGLIYGKQTCYIPGAVLAHARNVIDWWQDRSTDPELSLAKGNCLDSPTVVKRAFRFLEDNKTKDFYLLIYFGIPDCIAHQYGAPSIEYDEAVINVDKALGILLDFLQRKKLSSSILVAADHGWNVGTKGHSQPDGDTLTFPLLSNNSDLLRGSDASGRRKQCDITPTILDFFGVSKTNFQDIIKNGCDSMLRQSTR